MHFSRISICTARCVMWWRAMAVWCSVSWHRSVAFQMVIGQQSSGSSSNLTELQVVNSTELKEWLTDGWSCLTRQTQGHTHTHTDWHLYLLMPSFVGSHHTSECDFIIHTHTHTQSRAYVWQALTQYVLEYIYIYIWCIGDIALNPSSEPIFYAVWWCYFCACVCGFFLYFDIM